MADKYTASLQAEMLITAPCEHCHESLELSETLRARGTARQPDTARQQAVRGLQQQVDRIAAANAYPIQACPNCGHLQSWMRPGAARRVRQRTQAILIAGLWGTALLTAFGGLRLIDTLPLPDWRVGFGVWVALALLLPVGAAYLARQMTRRALSSPHPPAEPVKPTVGFAFTSAGAYAAVGMTLAHQNQFNEARQHFARALALNPAEPLALGGRGFIRYHEGDRAGARADLQQYAELAGDHADPKLLALLASLDDSVGSGPFRNPASA